MSERRLAKDVDIERIVQAALTAVAPETCLRRAVHVEGDQLHVAKETFDLSRIQRILVVGMGKASARMAASLEDLLGERISRGLVVTTDGYKVATSPGLPMQPGQTIGRTSAKGKLRACDEDTGGVLSLGNE
jgi:glycerate-2-kinase